MVVFPNAKVNLGLHVLRKRDDGYHDIETCFYPVPLCDVLEVLPARSFSFTQTGLPIPGESSDNLVTRAYQLLATEFSLPEVAVHLHKVIPMGAGLGGGSSDGAFMLKALNALFELKLTEDQLLAYAAKLGSDCPFFITNTPAIGTGTGTTLSPVNVSMSGLYMAIIHPGIHVSTASAYASLNPYDNRPAIQDMLNQPKETWNTDLQNDFTQPVTGEHAEISRLIHLLREKGAVYSAMSGSGSAVFGLFSEKPEINVQDTYFTWVDQLP